MDSKTYGGSRDNKAKYASKHGVIIENRYKKLNFGKKSFQKRTNTSSSQYFIDVRISTDLYRIIWNLVGCTFWESQVGNVIGSHVK